MKNFLAGLIRRLAPNTVDNLTNLNQLDPELREGPSRFIAYERELRTLRREIDEIRRDNRRVAELYDVVLERAKKDASSREINAGTAES